MHLRSVELQVPDRRAAVDFLKSPWGLLDTEPGTPGNVSYLRGTSAHSYVMAVCEGARGLMQSVTFAGSLDEVRAVWQRVQSAGLRHGPWVDAYDEPGQGAGFMVYGAEDEPFRFVAERQTTAALPAEINRPLALSHVVFNTRDREGVSRVLIEALGFKLSDRTRIMNFLRCDSAHHAIAYADSADVSLNHIAFDMASTDAVMGGMGRMKEAGFPTVWGPGRHGPGNNGFEIGRAHV